MADRRRLFCCRTHSAVPLVERWEENPVKKWIKCGWHSESKLWFNLRRAPVPHSCSFGSLRTLPHFVSDTECFLEDLCSTCC